MDPIVILSVALLLSIIFNAVMALTVPFLWWLFFTLKTDTKTQFVETDEKIDKLDEAMARIMKLANIPAEDSK